MMNKFKNKSRHCSLDMIIIIYSIQMFLFNTEISNIWSETTKLINPVLVYIQSEN